MPKTVKGAARAESKKLRVVKSLQREADRLGEFIAEHGDIPIGSPADDGALYADVKTLQREIDRLHQIVSQHAQSAAQTTSGAQQIAKQQAADASATPVRRLTVDDLEHCFDMLADLADIAVCEAPPRMGNLVWVMGQLAEKFSRDVETLRVEVCHD